LTKKKKKKKKRKKKKGRLFHWWGEITSKFTHLKSLSDVKSGKDQDGL
jgi:hypothetical protein